MKIIVQDNMGFHEVDDGKIDSKTALTDRQLLEKIAEALGL